MLLVKFRSRKAAETAQPDPAVAVVSITNPDGRADLKEGWRAVLRVEFHDIDPEKIENAFLRADLLRVYIPMQEQQAAEIIRFVDQQVQAGCSGFLVHCEAGVSRSAAVAKWIVDYYGLVSIDAITKLHNRHVYRLLQAAATGAE